MKNLYFIVLFLAWLLTLAPCLAKDIVVNPKGTVRTLADAIHLAASGDRIIVEKGTYHESGIQVNKAVQIIGQDRPEITGDNKGEIMTIISSDVLIEGLLFSNAGISYVNDNAAIKIIQSHDCAIRNNTFLNNFFAVYLSKSYRCTVENNTIRASGTSETSSGNGIHLWGSREVTIRNNHISGHRDGIYLEFSKRSTIVNNISEGNLRYGLHFMFSDSCSYRDNTFRRNGAGVAVMYTHYVEMVHNNFVDNWGAAAYGMLLKDISDSHIYDNHIERNTVGLYSEGSTRLLIEGNSFLANGWALKMLANSSENTIRKNNFLENSFDVSTNSTHSFNTFINNYWSNYRGYDLNHDGIGDVPFRPVRLFSLMVEKNPPALILLRSMMVDILDAAERVLPVLTPEALIDSQPLMHRVQ